MASSGPAVKPRSAPKNHNQYIADPVAHFRAIPWCNALLSDPAVLDTIIPDRKPLASGESNFVRRVMNSGTTVRACVTFFRMVKTPRGTKGLASHGLSRSEALLQGGGKADGEEPRNPFLLFNALLDLGEDLCGFRGTLHGGLFTVLMDEVMGTAANFQAEHGAYTVQFNTVYRKAVKLPQVVLVRARVIKKEGRKILARGSIEDKDGNLLGEADGVWIQMGRDIGRSQL
ncbi:Thioesterase/thiol ester dehydrase-isomerase [Podospora aff. communis PSN243]|uniref:Thioesterase/thiol ester dehydrase-isomerase n=1 Tax=Podospora aff. communis PSN243 TaxID=3040156 RepID=A0AAV9GRI9_9PEZI|nr:Thioesterase/thiol ester dehydrase-isomerase [Podospora aff. communis PSN243]